MRLLAVLMVLALQPSSCAPAPRPIAPAPAPVPAPVPAPTPAPAPPLVVEQPAESPEGVRSAACRRACIRMIELGCVAERTAGGLTCEDTFCAVSAGWDYACMQRALTCASLDRCNP